MYNNKETERVELHKTIWRIANDQRRGKPRRSGPDLVPQFLLDTGKMIR